MIRGRIQINDTAPAGVGRRWFRLSLLSLGGAGFMCLLIVSGVVAFQRPGDTVPLAATEERGLERELGQRPAPVVDWDAPAPAYEEVDVVRSEATTETPESSTTAVTSVRSQPATPPGVKFDRLGKVIMVDGKPWTGAVFDHRPIVPVRVQTMKTTAYSPDHRSCGKWADGITASGKSVWMNGGRLVAADRKIPYGTILTVPGYNYGKPVQVWDRGGKIKGNRLDLLYPTHEIAMRWGVQDKRVVFWEFVETD